MLWILAFICMLFTVATIIDLIVHIYLQWRKNRE